MENKPRPEKQILIPKKTSTNRNFRTRETSNIQRRKSERRFGNKLKNGRFFWSTLRELRK